MWYNDNEDVTAQSKNYFLREINNIVIKKQEEAAKRFGLNPPVPKTVAEAKEWYDAGKLTINQAYIESREDCEYTGMWQIADCLEWKTDVVLDEDGYNQYLAELSRETKRIERLIVASRLDNEGYDYDRDGGSEVNIVIDAIEQLETWDWTPPAKVIPLPTSVAPTNHEAVAA